MEYRFWTRGELRGEGWSPGAIATAVDEGRLIQVRKGHYAGVRTPPDLVRAMRVGGPATAQTAARTIGIWAPPGSALHVAVPVNTPRLRDPDDAALPLSDRPDVHVHWSPRLKRATAMSGRVSVLLMLQHLLQCTEPAFAVAALDSALHGRFLRPVDLAAVAEGLPAHLGALVAAADGRSESGIESIARYLLQCLGLHVEVQVVIPGVGRVDLLIDGRLIVELDGREWHGDSGAFSRDRIRDASAAARRYRTLRFTWAQVLYDWPSVQSAVLTALAS